MGETRSEPIPERHAIGERLTIDGREYAIVLVQSAEALAAAYGFRIGRDVPVYVLDGVGGSRKGAYVPSRDIVLFFRDTDDATKHHELIHVVEYHQTVRPGLAALYERVCADIDEDSFDGGSASFNFQKDIHEFIADGRSKPALIAALKRAGLYEDFIEETTYLFN